MPQIYGYGARAGGPLGGTPVPIPKKPVIHQGRPAARDTGFVMHSEREFTQAQVVAAEKRAKGRPGRRGAGRKDPEGRSRAAVHKVDVERIVKLYVEELKTLREIAIATNYSQTTVLKYLRIAEVEMRPRYMSRRLDAVEAAPKICANPDCGKKFTRREGERTDAWKRRLCCDRRCASRMRVLAAAAA